MKYSLTSTQHALLLESSLKPWRYFKTHRIGKTLVLFAAALAAWSLVAWVAAEALITSAPLPRADAILVLSNSSTYQERAQYAAGLWNQQRAPRVLLTNDTTVSGWSESEQRNPLFVERLTQELERSGVAHGAIECLPGEVENTYDEAVALRGYVEQNKLKSVLVVTSAYHSRRALSIFRRVFRDSDVKIGLEAVPPGQQTPRAGFWWVEARGWRMVATEYPKFVSFWMRNLFGESSATVANTAEGSLNTYTGQLLSAPATAYVDEVVLIDARGANGISPLPQADGSPSVELDFGDGFSANILASGHAYRRPGTYTIRVSGKDDSGRNVVNEARTINVVAIPAASAANVHVIKDTGNPKANAATLQRAIDQAAKSNTMESEIVLPAKAVFAGPIVLTTPAGTGSSRKYITIRSASLASLPPPGNRVDPGYASLMPTITAPSSTNETQSAMWTPNPAPAIPSHHYRLQGLHFKKDDDNRYAQALVSIGDSNRVQDKVSELPSFFIVDRCYFDGGSAKSATKDGLRINADFTSVVDSYLAPFQIAVGPDATAISIGKGHGPWAIWNSYMEVTSENFFIGGGGVADSWSGNISGATTTGCTLSTTTGLEIDMNIALPVGGKYGPDQTTVVRSVSGNRITYDPIPQAPDNGGVARWAVTPSFLEFRRNYLFKPTRWRQGSSDHDGSNWQLKNLWETKFLRYGVIDGNVMQNSWVKDQPFAIVLTPRNTNGGDHPAVIVRDLQFSNNIFRNLGNGVAIMPSDTQGGYNPTQRTTGITFCNNLFWNVGENWDPGYRQFFSYLDGTSPNDRSVRINFVHNTFDNGVPKNAQGMITDFGSNGGATQSIWKNNVAPHAGYGFRSAESNEPLANIIKFLPPSLRSWDRNLIANIGTADYPPRPRGIYVSGSWPAMFADYTNGDFTLSPNSPGKGKALDGTDVGVNMTALKAATHATKTGNWNPQ
ncbi:MAG: ElyC/SanA/YdcF family protein [Pyrinomonadaceae bacterium]